MIDTLTVYHYLALGLFLFITGISGSIICKNMIKILISIEFMLTGININFISFSAYSENFEFDGCIFVLFYTAIGAVELALAVYIFYLMYRKKGSDSIEQYGAL